MKKRFLIFMTALFAVVLSAGNVTYQLDMDFPQLKYNGNDLEIQYSDCLMMGEEGQPLLPWRGVDLLLPQNESVLSVNIVDKKYYSMEESGYIKPASRPFPISMPAPQDYQPQPLSEIYQNNAVFPENCLSSSTTGYLAGHGIASFSFCPVEYNPVQNSIRFIQSITISVETEYSSRAYEIEANLSNKTDIHKRIERIVDNPSALSSYSYNTNTRIIDYDLLLITNSELLYAFEDYIDFKESTGYSIAVELVEDIYDNYTGVDQAAQVRNCIISYYQSYDIEFVILGGDAGNSNEDAVVPHRGFAVDDEPSLPSDMYFSNLDGSWNNDGDGYWGEENEIDPYAEVTVGRICVDSPAEVTNAINKHIFYQNNPVIEDIEKIVMVGEELNNNPQTNGGDYKDQIADGGTYDGYYTEGVSGNFNINYIYERDMNWNHNNIYNEFSDTGINLLNHLGHSSPTYNMKLENSDLTTNNFTNNGLSRGYVVGYSQGCYNGSFDNWHYNGYYTEDCFAEKFSGGIATGEVACIANSRYGWYSPGGTNSSSQYYDRMFFHGIFGEGISQIGKINQYSHEDDVSMMQNSSNMRWTCYETNLFGDPSLDIWTEEPTDLTVTHPITLSIGVSSIQFTCDTPNARIGLVQDGQLIGRAVTDGSGIVNVETFEPIDSPGLISVSVIAHNKNRYQGNIAIVTDQPYVIMQSVAVNDSETGNDNGMLDYGESAYLDLSLNNVGNQLAEAVTASISTFDSNITITNSFLDCGNINGETIVDFPAAFSVEIADDVLDQHEAIISLIITDDESTVWNYSFNLTFNAPQISAGYAQIDDSNGNNDGVIDAGENINISIPTHNSGNAITGDVTAILLCFDPWVTVNTSAVVLSPIEPGQSMMAEFNVDVSPDTPEGTNIVFNFNASSATYAVSLDYSFTVGLVLEDFENGNFDTYDWTFDGEDWQIDDYAYNGLFSARSGSIGNNSISSMLIETWVRVSGDITFYKKVSCESDPDNHNFDWLAFYIDGQQLDRWDGEDPWSLESYPVSEGLHTFEWRYRKDQAVSSGSDAGWIDYIVFPPMGPPPPPEMVADLTAIELEMMPDTQTTQVVNLENLGVGEINYSVQLVDTTPDRRDLTGSSLVCNIDNYTPGETTGWVFELNNLSPDSEDITNVFMDFPDGVTVNVSTGFYGGSNVLLPDNTSGNGALVHWFNSNGDGILPGENATSGVNVTVDYNFVGEIEIEYELMGSDGSSITGSIYLFSLGIGWCNLSQNTGIIETFDSEQITLNFDSTGLMDQIYTADLIISDERTVLTIPITLTVPNTPVSDEDIVGATQLLGAFPNPFNPDTNIKFNLAEPCNIILDIFNIRGQIVSRLVEDSFSAGEHAVRWNGIDNKGMAVASGIYFCKFTAHPLPGRPDGNNTSGPTDYTSVTKIALMK